MKEGFLAFIKILFFLLILPLIIACTLALQTHVLGLPVAKEAWVLGGVVTYIVLNLFFYDFKAIYVFGQQIIAKVFSFFAPAVGIAGHVIPVYTLIIIIADLIFTIFGNAENYQNYFLFAIAFSLALHLIMAARQMHEEDNSPLKAQYFFGFGVVYVLNVLIIALLLAWVIPEFSFITFIKTLAHHTTHNYQEVYHLLFVDVK